MGKFRKKPVIIDAWQLPTDGGTPTDSPEWIKEAWQQGKLVAREGGGIIVKTLEDGNDEAKHVASPGDWIIRGVEGELYPCKPLTFAATYEPVL